MKKNINTIQDALAYKLQGLFYAESKVRDEFRRCRQQIESKELKTEMQKYIDNTENKLMKLDRIFNYLLQEPGPGKNAVIDKLVEETQRMLSYATTPLLKDILMVGCIQNINVYKIVSYKTAYMFAVELELDTVCDLIQQILDWEIETGRVLSAISITEFNKINNPIKFN